MDRDGDIRLDPDVVESGAGSRIPLSDLYELPVFASDTERKAAKLYAEETQLLERIRREVFEGDCKGKEDALLVHIRSHIFEAAPGFTAPKGGREEVAVQETHLPAEMTVTGFIAVILGIWRLAWKGRRRKLSADEGKE